jgi:hypothetical protein
LFELATRQLLVITAGRNLAIFEALYKEVKILKILLSKVLY